VSINGTPAAAGTWSYDVATRRATVNIPSTPGDRKLEVVLQGALDSHMVAELLRLKPITSCAGRAAAVSLRPLYWLKAFCLK
jgi:hypothetical protein